MYVRVCICHFQWLFTRMLLFLFWFIIFKQTLPEFYIIPNWIPVNNLADNCRFHCPYGEISYVFSPLSSCLNYIVSCSPSKSFRVRRLRVNEEKNRPLLYRHLPQSRNKSLQCYITGCYKWRHYLFILFHLHTCF